MVAYPYLFVDARYEFVRLAGRVVSMGVLIVVGVREDGRRESPKRCGWRRVRVRRRTTSSSSTCGRAAYQPVDLLGRRWLLRVLVVGGRAVAYWGQAGGLIGMLCELA